METIFACATPIIKSGVAIIRISGKESLKILRDLTKRDFFESRKAYLCKIHNPFDDIIIDEGLALYFKSPNSFTGEDIAEIHLHGSRAVINEMLEILSNFENIRLAEAGEFSMRAFNNGKMDLTEAEGLVDLINAETKAQARQALRQKQGYLGKLYQKWREEIISILANIEAYIDFPDEEIPQSVIGEIDISVFNLKNEILTHLNDSKTGEKLRDGAKAVILGKPNVGKSSIINNLAKREVAIVSDIAGTTRDLIEVHLDLKGYPVTIIDTAGIRESNEDIEKQGIERALKISKNADIKIVVFDAVNLNDADISLVDENSIVVINKIDQIGNLQIPANIMNFNPISISAINDKSLDRLIEALSKNLQIIFDKNLERPLITRQRYRNLLNKSYNSLSSFTLDKELELACEDLRSAAFYIGQITGKVGVEDILDKIFSSFCIGK